MTKRRIKNKWYTPNGWHTPRGWYREIKEMDKEITRKCLQEKRDFDFKKAMEK